MADRITVIVPDLGDFHDVEVIEVLVKAGDTVAVDTPLITLETDKATMDVPSTAAGRIAALSVKKGDRVSKGSRSWCSRERRRPRPASAAKAPPAPKPESAANAPAASPVPAAPATRPRHPGPAAAPRDAAGVGRECRSPGAHAEPRPCGDSRANSASTSRSCRAPASRAGSARTTSKPSSSRRLQRRNARAPAPPRPVPGCRGYRRSISRLSGRSKSARSGGSSGSRARDCRRAG